MKCCLDAPNGDLLWVKSGPLGDDSTGLGIAVDGDGNILITGHFQSTADFGGISLTSVGLFDIFMAKLGLVMLAVNIDIIAGQLPEQHQP